MRFSLACPQHLELRRADGLSRGQHQAVRSFCLTFRTRRLHCADRGLVVNHRSRPSLDGDDGSQQQSRKRPRTPSAARQNSAGRKAAPKEAPAPKKRRSPPQHCMPIEELLLSAQQTAAEPAPPPPQQQQQRAPSASPTSPRARAPPTVRDPFLRSLRCADLGARSSQAEPDIYRRQYSSARGNRQRASPDAAAASPSKARRRSKPHLEYAVTEGEHKGSYIWCALCPLGF